jgi:acylphosphatase
MKPDPLEVAPAHALSSLDVRVAGRVQGVGFRYFVYEIARQRRLTGYVMNLRDGSVRAYAEGPRDSLEEFLRFLRQGPTGARVQDVRATWRIATGQYSTFNIQPSL